MVRATKNTKYATFYPNYYITLQLLSTVAAVNVKEGTMDAIVIFFSQPHWSDVDPRQSESDDVDQQ